MTRRAEPPGCMARRAPASRVSECSVPAFTIAMLLLWSVVWSSVVVTLNALNSTALGSDLTCGGTLNSTQPLTLRTPGHPGRHPPGLRCSWTLDTASACGLTLLGDLGLRPCPSDVLQVGGVQLCGDLPRVVYLPVRSEWTDVTFRGSPDGGPGLNITIRQTECGSQFVNMSKLENRVDNLENYSCGGEFYGDNVVIQSPGFPSSYPPDSQCKYTIIRTEDEVCEIEITFDNSSLEASNGCFKDRLEIQGDHLCGEFSGVRTFVIDKALEIRFVSDSEGSDKGFKLLARQIKCSDTPIVVDAEEENEKQDVLIDCVPQGAPVFPAGPGEGYPRVRPFPSFPLPGVNQNFPPPQNFLPQNEFRGTPPLQRIPPLQHPSFNPSNKNYPHQGYISPDFSRQSPNRLFSFHPSVPTSFNPFYTPPPLFTPAATSFPQIPQCCGRIYTDNHFLIVSPGFPRSQSAECIYTIQRYSPLTFQLRFQFRYFWVGQDTGEGCSGGVLEIDGIRICGCKTGIIWTSPFFDSEAVKVLHLRLDSPPDRLFSGFVLEVYQDDSYSRYKRDQSNPSSEEFTLSNGTIVNFTQYVETFVQREPVGFMDNQVDRSHNQLVWDPNRQMWSLPTDLFCLRWSYQDWIILAKEALWSQYQCPTSAPSTSVSQVDSSRFDITACRTCYYFCRQNCQCC